MAKQNVAGIIKLMKAFVDYWKNHPIELVGFFWLGLLFLGIILTLSGFFYAPILALYLVLGAVLIIYLLIFNRKKIKVASDVLIVSLLSLIVIIFLSNFTVPSIFSGRDQGSLSEAAIRLVQNHQLKFSFPAEHDFFQIYGPGKALNFPGFDYTKDGQLITQFPIGYISWLAVFYSFFSLNGLVFANGITFFVFLLSFYLMCRAYLKGPPAIVAYLIILSSFIFSWFFKFTLSENLAMALIWFGIFELTQYFNNKKYLNLALGLFSFYLLAFTRIEALAFIVMIFVILFFKSKKSKDLAHIFSKKALLIFSPFILIYLISLYVNWEFYITFIKGLLGSLANYENIGGLSVTIPAVVVLRVFTIYGLTVYLAFGIVGFFYLYNKKKMEYLLPFFVLFPSLIYLIYPSITLDHPWMLRRYIFSVLPLLMFSTVCFLYYFFNTRKMIFYIFSALLILSNFSLSIMYLGTVENNNLLPQVQSLSRNFQNSDLVLVDQEASGSGWSMISGPMNFLYQKQAVYFFNPEDINKIDLGKFSHVYFIIPDQSLDFWKKFPIMGKLALKKEYQIDSTAFNSSEITSSDLPIIQAQTIHGGIYVLEN